MTHIRRVILEDNEEHFGEGTSLQESSRPLLQVSIVDGEIFLEIGHWSETTEEVKFRTYKDTELNRLSRVSFPLKALQGVLMAFEVSNES